MEPAVWRALAPLAPGCVDRWGELADPAPSLGALDRIRATRGPAVARFVSLQAELARQHRGRLDGAALPFLTSKGAEQATATAVARHRAERFARAGLDRIPWDACCGVGSDLLALAERFDRVLATDLDPDTLRCAAANLACSQGRPPRDHGLSTGASWLAAIGDAVTPPFLPTVEAQVLGLFDPDRRPAGSREGRADRWSPALDTVFQAAANLGGACVKLPPSLEGSNLSRAAGDLSLALSWTSLDGEMKELSAWSGVLCADAPRREAVSLRSSGEARSYSSSTQTLPEAEREPRQGQWLVELDPALWRANLAGAFAAEHGAAPLEAPGPGGFLVAQAPLAHPMARSWQVKGVVPADRRRVRALLREHAVGPLTVKTRHHPQSAEALAMRFRSSGSKAGLLAVTRVAGRALALLLEEGLDEMP